MNRHFAVPVLILLAACGGRTDHANAPTIDTLPGGIIRVANHGPTEWTDTNGWKLVLERTIASVDSTPGQLNNPGGLVADSRGRIFVLDTRPALIKVYGPDGLFAGTIGREGSGPGEFQPGGTLTISRDTLVLHDSRQTRTQSFTGDGALLRGWRSLCCWQLPVLADDSGRTPVPGTIRPDSTGKVFLAGVGFIRYRANGSIVDTVILPPRPERKMWRAEADGNTTIWSVPLTAGQQGTFDRAGHYVWGNQDRYAIVISRNGLDTARLFSASTPGVPIPDSIRTDRLKQVLKSNPAMKPVAKLGDIPVNYPLWTAISVDGDGNYWVLRPGPHSDGDVWDVFTADGTLLGAVPAPFHDISRSYWTRDRVYNLDDDEATGAQAIKVYRIERHSNTKQD